MGVVILALSFQYFFFGHFFSNSDSFLSKPAARDVMLGSTGGTEILHVFLPSMSAGNTGCSVELFQVFVFLIPPDLTYMESL